MTAVAVAVAVIDSIEIEMEVMVDPAIEKIDEADRLEVEEETCPNETEIGLVAVAQIKILHGVMSVTGKNLFLCK